MKIALTGTPGTGKSEVSRRLGELLKLPVVDLNAMLTNEFALERDEERDTLVVDIERAAAEVELPRDCIIEGHLSHFIPVDIILVLRCRPNELQQRLAGKGWSVEKVEENVEAEALNLISEEARERSGRVFDVDTTGKSPDETVARILKVLGGSVSGEQLDFLEYL